MRFAILLAVLVVAALPASARDVRAPCDDGARCEGAQSPRNAEPRNYDTERHAVPRPTQPKRRIDTGERAPHNPPAPPASQAHRKAPSQAGADVPGERDRTASRAGPPDEASGDAGGAALASSSRSSPDPSGLRAWSGVIIIVMAAAGALSLVIARMADA